MKISIFSIVALILCVSLIPIPSTCTQGTAAKETRIISPANNSEVHGSVVVIAEVEVCNDTSSFVLNVDGQFVSNGTFDEKKGIYSRDNISYCHWNYVWNTKDFSDGVHKVRANGAHEYYDEIDIHVKNQVEKKIPGFETSTLISIIGMCLMILELKRYRSFMPRT